MTLVYKEQAKYYGSIGLLLWLSGAVFVKRGSKTGFLVLNETLLKLKEKKISLWIFPEGTRNSTGDIGDFKRGAFHAAIIAQVPIVPVVFSCYKGFLNYEKKIFNSGDIIIEALPEISTEGLTADDVDDLIAKTRSLMIAKYDQLNSEISP